MKFKEKNGNVFVFDGGKNTYGDILWLIGKFTTKKRLMRFACDCALVNIELIKPYIDDYELIKDFLVSPSPNAASYVVVNAANAANVAYTANADNAVCAAAATANATYASNVTYAVYAATNAAAAASNPSAVNSLLIELINEIEIMSLHKIDSQISSNMFTG